MYKITCKYCTAVLIIDFKIKRCLRCNARFENERFPPKRIKSKHIFFKDKLSNSQS